MLELYQREYNKLRKYKDYYLKRKVRNNAIHYYRVRKGDTYEEYLGTADHPTVIAMKRFKHYECLVSVLNGNIKFIEKLLNKYVEPSPDTINAKLKLCYRSADNSQFVSPSQEGRDWMEKMKRIKDGFDNTISKAYGHRTIDNCFVKSKSELAIYNFLYANGIPFVYELPVETPLGMLYPDFTIYDVRTGEVFYWEHLGMLYKEEYFMRQFTKLHKYASIGYTPGVNLIISVDDINGFFDTTVIRKKVEMFLGEDACNGAAAYLAS